MRRAALLLLAALLSGPSPAATPDGKKVSATPNRHGAIAHERATKAWGVSFDFARQRDAGLEALKQCGQPKCEVVHKFRNGCAALAHGPKKSFAASGVTRAEAETKALRLCEAAGGECTPLAWACTR